VTRVRVEGYDWVGVKVGVGAVVRARVDLRLSPFSLTTCRSGSHRSLRSSWPNSTNLNGSGVGVRAGPQLAVRFRPSSRLGLGEELGIQLDKTGACRRRSRRWSLLG
jgi:hypothetical protein